MASYSVSPAEVLVRTRQDIMKGAVPLPLVASKHISELNRGSLGFSNGNSLI